MSNKIKKHFFSNINTTKSKENLCTYMNNKHCNRDNKHCNKHNDISNINIYKSHKYFSESIAFYIQKQLINYKENPYDSNENSIFDLKKQSKITLSDYILRIIDIGEIEMTTIIHSISLIHKLLLIDSLPFKLTYRNINLILFTSCLISVKLMEDNIYEDCFYAKVGGISIEKLKSTEAFFLELIDYDLFLSETEYTQVYLSILYRLIEEKFFPY